MSSGRCHFFLVFGGRLGRIKLFIFTKITGYSFRQAFELERIRILLEGQVDMEKYLWLVSWSDLEADGCL